MGFDLNRVIRGRVWKFGDSIETDAINPYYKYPTMEELKLHTMETYRPEFPREVNPGDVLVAGRNFGCGSSRPGLVLREVGIAAIVAESVARLFLRNSISRAIPIFVAPGVSGIIEDGATLEVDYPAGVVRNPASGANVRLRKYPPAIEQIFECGGLPQFAYERYLRESALARRDRG
ncbi:MAG TPA: 3-isopropylmalate dehydratase [Burkholderiales bacterium]|nr:3-isopropylmalate dehydratase [Burkholderiales bacterium]